jgi:radical SAM superfamily enzyme YgiQ (UPF0313 family)
MKTIAFVNPPFWTTEESKDQEGRRILRQGIRAGSRWPFTRLAYFSPDQYRHGAYLPFPFFMASAAGYVKHHGEALSEPFTAIFRDSVARGESYTTFVSEMARIQPYGLVIETGAAAWEHDKGLIAWIKGQLPGIRVAVAGPTAASAAKTTPVGLVDAFLIGEYEKTSLRFANGEGGILGFDLLSRQELNEVPFPLFDDQAWTHYWDACPKGQRAPHLQMFTSRGCFYKCCFCAWPGTMTSDDPDGSKPRSVRFYSPQWIEKFITQFRDDHMGVQCVYFDDDTFNLSDKHVLDVCGVMKRIGLPWSAMCRADTSKPDTWQTMKDSGCFGVKLGFESGVQRVIDQIVNKGLDLKKARETAIWLRKEVGMTVHGTFTIGLPGETKEESEQTIQFIRDLYADGGLDTHQLSGTAMIENTPLAQIAEGKELTAYPGAKADKNFITDRDGVRKLEALQ